MVFPVLNTGAVFTPRATLAFLNTFFLHTKITNMKNPRRRLKLSVTLKKISILVEVWPQGMSLWLPWRR